VNTHTLSVLVEDKSGVLARIAGLFARRGYNIASLAVGPTEVSGVSRITVQVSVESQLVLEQITKQLNKLVEVLKVVELDPQSSVSRELMLIKLRADPATRSQIIEIVQLFRGKTVDVQNESMTIEATGSPDKLEALLEMLKPYGVRELVQSGLVALGRGSHSLTERPKPDRSHRSN
jgi:acetolactate synthase-1/3 small subunit